MEFYFYFQTNSLVYTFSLECFKGLSAFILFCENLQLNPMKKERVLEHFEE